MFDLFSFQKPGTCMANIDTKGMEVASLSQDQLNRLISAEKELNNAGAGQEIYLLAVSRHPEH